MSDNVNGLQPTTSNNANTPRADLVQDEFDTLVYQKGRPVLFEKALQCPCKSESTNQQSNCKNCGGSGWLFVNPTETRMLVQQMGAVNNIKAWSEETIGTVAITSRSFEYLTYMDRISLLDSFTVYNEVKVFKQSTSDPTKYFCFPTYSMLKLLYAGLFISTEDALVTLAPEDFTLDKNTIKINASILDTYTIPTDFSITLKYTHPPTFHILDMKRETMESFVFSGGVEKNQRFPVSAIARKTHYLLDRENLTKTRILNNDYIEPHTCI